jgi:hypothetical protein
MPPSRKKRLSAEEQNALAQKGGWKMGAKREIDQVEQTEENAEQHREAIASMILETIRACRQMKWNDEHKMYYY